MVEENGVDTKMARSRKRADDIVSEDRYLRPDAHFAARPTVIPALEASSPEQKNEM